MLPVVPPHKKPHMKPSRKWFECLDHPDEEPYPGFNRLFKRFEKLRHPTTKLHTKATHEVRTLEEPQWKDRKDWWTGYGEQHGIAGHHLMPFFMAWFLYRPRPEGRHAVPSKEFPFGVADSPGYLIEKWDWVANTENGMKLIMDDYRWRKWFKDFMNLRGEYLKSHFSWPDELAKQWTNYKGDDLHPFDLSNYIVPKGGYQSFNDFFLRWCDLECERPLGDQDNNFAISAPADGGIFYLSMDTSNPTSRFTLPGKSGDTFNLIDAFPKPYGKKFVGGPLLDTLLWFTDFHHFFAPVSGKLVSKEMYRGSYNYDFYDYDDSDTDAPKPSDSSDRAGWYNDLGKHKRQIWVFKTKDMGYVGMCAVGFWGVGSILTEPDPQAPTTWAGGTDAKVVQVGDIVKKGDYLGHFGYGGSSIVLACEPCLSYKEDLIYDFTAVSEDGTPMKITDADNPVLVKARQTVGMASIKGLQIMKSNL